MAKPLTVKLPEELHALVNAAAQRGGVTQSAVVRRALERYFAKRKPGARTFGELSGHLRGAGAGPRTLSTGKQHMKDYGK
jgi:metal-responsive CopG/Arc/MetJ family transcriptional regulator